MNMNLFRTSSRAASILIPLAILAGTTSQFLNREIGGFAALLVAQSAIAAAIFFSLVSSKDAEREPLSVYNEIRGYK